MGEEFHFWQPLLFAECATLVIAVIFAFASVVEYRTQEKYYRYDRIISMVSFIIFLILMFYDCGSGQ